MSQEPLTLQVSPSKDYGGPHHTHVTGPKTAPPMALLGFAVLQEFFKHCEVGDVCIEEDVVVEGRTHFHCLLCQAMVRSASKLQDHCMRHANNKAVPAEHEMCVKYFTCYMPTCIQNCQLSQTATKHRHCKLCGGAHTDSDTRGLGIHVECWHTRHYTEVKEIVDLAKKLRSLIQPDQSQDSEIQQQQDQQQQQQHQQQQSDVTVQMQANTMGPGGENITQAVYTQGVVPPGSWQTSTTQMTDGTMATVHQWTGGGPPVYPPNLPVQSMDQTQQDGESYILQEHQVGHTGSEFVIQEAAAQSGVDEGFTLQVETSSLNPSQEAASIILQMMDRVQIPPADHQPAPQTNPQEVVIETESSESRKRHHHAEDDSNQAIKSSRQDDGDSLPLIFKSKPLPGTVINPVATPPKVCHQCLVCRSGSYLRSIRVTSESNRRHMNKAQTARLMTYYKLAVDPMTPGKVICKKDFEAWLEYDKKLQQLLHGSEEEKLQKTDERVSVTSRSPGRRRPLSASRRNKSELSPPSQANAGRGRPRKISTQIRVPRSRRLQEKHDKESSEMEEGGGTSAQQDGDVEHNRAEVNQENEGQIVVVSVPEVETGDKSGTGEAQFKVIINAGDGKEGDEATEGAVQDMGNKRARSARIAAKR